MNKKIKNEDIPLIIKEYLQLISTCNIAKKYKVSAQTISNILKKNDIVVRNDRKTFHFNENYFKKIDTEIKAYFLGFLYADGSVSKNRNITAISIKDVDIEILEVFKKDLGTDKKIYRRSSLAKLEIVSKVIKEDLIRLGCVPSKTYNLKFPTKEQVPIELVRHFIRGFFDGDGCIGVYNKQIRIQIVGTWEILRGLREFLESLGIQKIKINKGRSIPVLCIFKKESVIKFCNLMFKDSNVYLTRKNKIWTEWCKYDIKALEEHLKLKGII